MTKAAGPGILIAILLFAGCSGPKPAALQDLTAHTDLALFKLQSFHGTRDGDHLAAQAMFSDSSSILSIQMRFAIGSPTTLQSGDWRWSRNGELLTGAVTARSVTFLGGQDGPPSIGGAFDLRGADGAARYRVTIPLTELKRRL